MLLLEKYFQNCQACFGRSECEWVKYVITQLPDLHYFVNPYTLYYMHSSRTQMILLQSKILKRFFDIQENIDSTIYYLFTVLHIYECLSSNVFIWGAYWLFDR